VSVLLPYAALLLVLLMLSAFFSGSESALFSLDRYALEKLDDSDRTAGKTVRRLLEEPRRLLATILLGNELVNITISAVGLAAVFAWERAHEGTSLPVWVNIVVVTPLLLLFGEIAPKALAVRLGHRWARAVAWPLRVFGWIVAPLRAVLHGVADGLLGLLGITPDDPLEDALKEAQFKALVKLGERQGVIASEEAELIHRVFDLSDLPVSKVMTPAAEVVALSTGMPVDDLLAQARSSRFSRMPAWSGDEATVRGILMTKDLLRFQWAEEPPDRRALEALLRPAWFVPPGKTCGELLQDFQHEHGHMAIVLDEHGGMLGIITLQDILEELFEPLSETEQRPNQPKIERLSDGLYRIPARLEVAEWNRSMEPSIPEGDSYNTVAGYIFHLFGRLPSKGDTIRDAGWIWGVTGIEGTRLTTITAKRREGSR